MNRSILILSLISACWVASLTPLLASTCNLPKIQECGLAGDDACAYAEARKCLDSSDLVLVNENGELMLSGARLEFAFRRASDGMEPAEVRRDAEYLLSHVGQHYPTTGHLLTMLHTIRFESCSALEDDNCAIESARFLCDNAPRLAMPTMRENEKDEVLGRVFAAMDTQCKEE